MAKSNSLLFGPLLLQAAKPLFERLGKPDGDQLRRLLDLAVAERTVLSDILSKLYPDKVGSKALVAFTSLRKRLNDAAGGQQHDLSDLRLRHHIDSKKRSSPAERTCWFTGPDLRTEAAAELSRLSAQDVESVSVVPPQGVATSTGALRSGKRTVRFFVSYSREKDESRLATKLLSLLRIQFGASPRYEIELWMDRDVRVDREWDDEIQNAIKNCDFGLLLVCPAFLGSKYIKEHELRKFVTPEGKAGVKPVIAVGLTTLNFQKHDLKGLEHRQIYRLYKGDDPSGKFFSNLQSGEDQRRFAEDLYSRTQDALDLWFADSSAKAVEFEQSEGEPENVPARSRKSAKRTDRFVADGDSLDVRETECDRTSADGEDAMGVKIHSHQDGLQPHCDLARDMFEQARMGRDLEEIKHYEPVRGSLRGGTQSIDAMQYLRDWLSSEDSPPILYLLGEFGIGKTTTVKQLTMELLDRRKSDPALPLPLFIDLRQYLFDRKQYVPTSIHELLTAVIARNWQQPGLPTVTADDLLGLVRDERALLIFDGLDEKTVHLTPAEARAFIRVLWQALPEAGHRKLGSNSGQRRSSNRQQAGTTADVTSVSVESPISRPSGRLIISCRSHYFRDVETETSMLTGEDREGIDSKNTPVLTLLPFTEQQIRNYLNGLFDGDSRRANDAFSLISSIHKLGELASRPYLLSLIVERLEEFKTLRERGETVNAARLYQLFTQRWLNRDDGKHSLDPVHKRMLMEQLAADFWRDSISELEPDALERWLDRFLSEHSEISNAYMGIDRKILKEDFRTACFVLREDQRIEADNSRAGDCRSAFRFAHTSLQEFFLAAWLWHGLVEGDPKAFDLPMVSMETLDFLGQMLQLETERQRSRALERMGQILSGECVRAATLVFRYWLRAIERGFPVPEPTVVNLAGANLDELVIRGFSRARPLNLRGAKLTRTRLNRSRLEWVDLSGADLTCAQLRQAVLIEVNALGAGWVGSDLSGVQWRRGSLSGADLRESILACELVHVTVDGARLPDETQANAGVPVQWGLRRDGPMAFLGHASGVMSCAWSPDGTQLVSGSYDRTLKVWDASSGACRLTLSGHASWVMSCAWSPDGTQLVSGSSDQTLKVWDASSGACRLTLSGHASVVRSCAWSPDGTQLVSGSNDQTLKVWDASSGACRLTLSGHANGVMSCAWSPDGTQLVSGSYDRTLKVWDASSGACRLTLSGHANAVMSCAWSPDGTQLVSGSSDQTLKVWDASSGACRLTLSGHANAVMSCAWSPDGTQLVSGSFDPTLKVWDASSGACRLTLSGHANGVMSCAWSPDGTQLVSGSSDQTLKVWDASSGACRLTLSGHASGVRSCAWSPDRTRLVSCSYDNTLKVWDASSGACRLTLSGHANGVMSCAWSPDGTQLVSGSYDETLKVWDASSGACRLTLPGHTSGVMSCAWSPDGTQLVSGSSDRTLKVWDASSGACRLTLSGHADGVMSCAWSPDGTQLVSGSFDRTLKVWDASSGACRLTLSGHADGVMSCAWSPDGTQLVSGSSDQTLKVWDASSGACRLTLSGHATGVTSCAWSPDGTQLVSGSDDQTLKVWDASSGACRLTLSGHTDGVRSCAWSPGGTQLVSGSDDRTLKVWDASSGVCLWTGHILPEQQWASFDDQRHSVCVASPEAWRWLGWLVPDPKDGRLKRISIESFGPVPGLDP